LLFYSRPRWFLRFWLSPLGRALVCADPVPEQEVSRFSGVRAKKTYGAGAATLVDIAAGAARHTVPPGSKETTLL
jgi:hypothetical protein